MNISTGISEINFLAGSSSTQKAGKAYLWPVYNAGAVTQVQKISRETASDISYIKPFSGDPNDNTSHVRYEEYSSKGKVNGRPSSYHPGYYFNALA